MKINETLDYFLDLKNKTEQKAEKRIYEKFVGILSDLKHRDLTEKQLDLLETELNKLILKPETDNKKKFLEQKLAVLEKFLRDNLSLVSEGYYCGYGICFGMLAGVMAQFYFGLFSMLGGMLIGIIIGGIMDSEARKQGRVLKTKVTE